MGADNTNERAATDMLKAGETLEKIAGYSRLDEEATIKLAQTLGLTVM